MQKQQIRVPTNRKIFIGADPVCTSFEDCEAACYLGFCHCLSFALFNFPSSFSDERSEEHTSELQSQSNLVCRLLLEKKKTSCASSRPGGCWSRALYCSSTPLVLFRSSS